MRLFTYLRLKKYLGGAAAEETDHLLLYRLTVNGIPVRLYITKARATRATHILLTESGDLIREVLYPFGGLSRPARERTYILKPTAERGAITVIIIRGTPGSIVGLDNVLVDSTLPPYAEGRTVIRSHLFPPAPSEVYLMTEKRASAFLSSIGSAAEE